MIEKKDKIVITFFTTAAAMKMEDICRQQGADGRIIPTPTAISADCGLAWCADPQSEDILSELMAENDINCQGIYRCMI